VDEGPGWEQVPEDEWARDNANHPGNRVYVDIGGTDTDVYERFYMEIPTLASGAYIQPHMMGNDNNEHTIGIIYYQIYFTGAEYRLNIRNNSTGPTDYFVLTAGSKYRLEAHIVQNSTCTLKVWDAAGTAIQTSAGGGDYEVSHTGLDRAIQYFIFRDHSSSSTESTYYIDDYVIDVDGTDYIGPE